MPKNAPATRTLIVVPEDTVLPVLGLVTLATRSVDVKQFTLDEPRIIQALLDAHRRGVAVRVMLNPHRSSGSRANDDTFAALEQAQVPVQWTNPAFAVTHEKSMVVDGERALVATFNFSEKYFTQTRDYGIVTTDPAQVAQIVAGLRGRLGPGAVRPRRARRPALEHDELAPDHVPLHRRARRSRSSCSIRSSSTPPCWGGWWRPRPAAST